MIESASMISLCRRGSLQHAADDAPISRSLRMYGEWAEAEIGLLSTFIASGDSVADVGANVGTHALAFADRVGEQGSVLAVEVQPQLYDMLTGNVVRNGFSQIRTTCIAIGASGSSEAHARSTALAGFGLGACALVRVAIPGLALPVLTQLAEDADGARPVICVQCESAESAALVVAHPAASEYRTYLARSRSYNPSNFNMGVDGHIGPKWNRSLLLVPAEQISQVPETYPKSVELIPLFDAKSLLRALLAAEYADEAEDSPDDHRESQHVLEEIESERRRVLFRQRSLEETADRMQVELDRRLEALAAMQAERDGALESLALAKTEHDRAREALSEALSEARAERDEARREVTSMLGSTSWRATAAIRRVTAGSKRHRRA